MSSNNQKNINLAGCICRRCIDFTYQLSKRGILFPSGTQCPWTKKKLFKMEKSLSEAPHQYTEFVTNSENGYMKLDLNDGYATYVKRPEGFGSNRMNTTKLDDETTKKIRKTAKKMKKNYNIEMRFDYSNWDALIAEFMEMDDEEDITEEIDEVVEQMLSRPKIKVTFEESKELPFYLIAGLPDDDVVFSPQKLVKLVEKRFEIGDGAFFIWFCEYMGEEWSPLCGGTDAQFLLLHPNLFHYILGFSASSNTYQTVKYKDLINFLTEQPPENHLNLNIAKLDRKLAALLLEASGVENVIKGLKMSIEFHSKAISKLPPTQNNDLRREQYANTIKENRIKIEDRTKHLEMLQFKINNFNKTLHPSMEVETDNEVRAEYDIANNTALSTEANESETIPTDIPMQSIISEIMTDQKRVYPELTNRFIAFDTIRLSTSINKGTIIAQYHMPSDFVIKNWNTPNMLPFRTHEFVRGGIEMKLASNIVKTSQFCLQAGYVYHWIQRDRRQELINIHTISQQPGCRINGHMSPSDSMIIPFASFTPQIPIRANQTQMNLYFVTVTLVAMTDFEVADGAVEVADLVVYAKFLEDLEFTGQVEINNEVPSAVVLDVPRLNPAMMSAALAVKGSVVKNAKSALSGVAAHTLNTANSLVRGTISTATRSLNRGIENSISQAFASRGSNRDKPTDFVNNAFHQRAIPNIASGSGTFAADSLRLQQIGSAPHHPNIIGVEKFTSIRDIIEIEGFVNSFTVKVGQDQGTKLAEMRVQPGIFTPFVFGGNFPNNISNWAPVDHFAGWFLNYHGRLTYTFRVVADGFKTFRLRVAYVPNERTLTFEESNSVYYETFSVGSDLDAQQTFAFDVPYIHNQTNYNHRSVNRQAIISGSIHVFIETQINGNSTGFPSCDVLVFKAAMKGQMTFTVPRNNFSMLKIDNSDIPDQPGPQPPPLPQWRTFNYFIRFTGFSLDNTNWVVTVSLFNKDTNVQLSTSRFFGTIAGSVTFFAINGQFRSSNGALNSSSLQLSVVLNNPPLVQAFKRLLFVGDAFEELFVPRDTVIGPADVDGSFEYLGSPPIFFLENEGLQVINAAGDIRMEDHDAAPLVPQITLLDSALHGEDFMHLYENLRRFHHFHSLTTEAPAATNPVRIFTLPCNLGAALFRQDLTEIQRTDKIIHMHDAFRFYRGSLRFFFTITSSYTQGVIRVVHKPQYENYPFTTEEQLLGFDYGESGWGETVISLQQNNVSTLEVPMYLPTQCVLTASYLSDEYLIKIAQGLGVLEFYWQGEEADVRINISRALADDAQFYGFNGFPLRSNISDIPPALNFYRERERFLEPAGESVLPALKIEFNKKLDKKIMDSLGNVDNLTATLQGFIESLGSTDSQCVIVGTLVSQIAHVIVNPTLKTFCLSMFQILLNLGVIRFAFIQHLEACFVKIWEKFSSDSVTEEGTTRPAGEVEEDMDVLTEISTTIVSGVAALHSVNSSHKVSFTEKITDAFALGGTIHSKILHFIKAILKFVQKATTWVTEKFFPDSILHKYLKNDTITKWISRASVLTDPCNFNKIKKCQRSAMLVFKLVRQGESIMMHAVKKERKGLPMLISGHLVALKKLRANLALNADVPKIKYDPFCAYIYGQQSQIGKSEMLYELAEEILVENNICNIKDTDKTYVVPESDKWWTGYFGQKCIIFDDFGRITPADVAESDCARLCNLKCEAKWEVPKPFEDKGAQSVTKLILCASNISHPKHNGIREEVVVWERRNILYHVTADFSIYKTCADHSLMKIGFKFSCSRCRAANPDENFKDRRHLKIRMANPIKPTLETYDPDMTYLEFKKDLIARSKEYYKMQDARYDDLIQGKIQIDSEFCNFLLPLDYSTDYDKLLSDEYYTSVMTEIETVLPSGGWYDNLSHKVVSLLSKTNKEIENVTLEERPYSCHHERIFYETIEPINYDPLTWSIHGQTVTIDCTSECNWMHLKNVYWGQLYEKLVSEDKIIPHQFPAEYNLALIKKMDTILTNQIIEIESQPWYIKHRTLTRVVGVSLGLVGLLLGANALFKSYKKRKLTNKDIDSALNTVKGKAKISEIAIKETHPALMASGDLKTKFSARIKTFKQHAKKFVQSKSKVAPAGASEFDSMKKCYIESLVEMKSYDSKYTARCIAVQHEFYLTQIHSLCAVIATTAKKLAEKFAECNCPRDALGTANHTDECVVSVNNQFPITFTRYTKKLDLHTINVTLIDLFKMNDCSFGIDGDGTDIVTFVLKPTDLNFTTSNISKYLVKKDNHYVNTENMAFMDPGPMRNGSPDNVYEAKGIVQLTDKFAYEASSCSSWSDKAITVEFHGFVVNNPEKGGFKQSCGSILIDKTTCLIVGVMSATTDTSLYFNAINSEDMEKAYELTNTSLIDCDGVRVMCVLPAYETEEFSKEFCKDDFEIFNAKKEDGDILVAFNSVRTTLKPSECNGVFIENQRIPAHLAQPDGKGNLDKGMIAFVKGIDQYRRHKDFPDDHIDLAYMDISEMYKANCVSDMPVVSKRTVEEAICGIHTKIGRVVMSTSPGFPYCCDTRTKRKTDLVKLSETEAKIEWIHEKFLQSIEMEEEMMERGEKPLTIFQASLKDERLKPEKVKNPRIIQGSSFTLTANTRRYMMDFNYAFQLSRKNLEHAVGINVESLEWNELALDLVQFSPYICVGDYSKFGPRLSSKFVLYAYKIINDWYKKHNSPDKHNIAREVLGRRAIDSLNIFGRHVVKVKCGSPSGAINTVIINSICNLFYIRCAWIGIMQEVEPTISGLHHFKKFVRFYCYGDDVIFSVKPEVIEIFNNVTISEYFKKFDVKYTDVTKGDSMRKYCMLDEASFLKRGFGYFTETAIKPGVYIPTADYKEILDICNWVRKPKGTKTGSDISVILQEAAISNCEDAIRKSWFLGRVVFNETQDMIRSFWANRSPIRMPTFYTFEGLQTDYGIPLDHRDDNFRTVFPSSESRHGHQLSTVPKHNDKPLDKEVITQPSIERRISIVPVTERVVDASSICARTRMTPDTEGRKVARTDPTS